MEVKRVPKTNQMILENGEKPIKVSFTKSFTPFVKGDVAGFGKKQVNYLVDELGVAEIYKTKK